MRLITAKLDAAAAIVQAEGWKWVKPELTRDHSIHYGRIWAGADTDDEDEGEGEEAGFSPEQKARAGALVQIGHDGTIRIERGLIHPDDIKAEAKRERGAKKAGGGTAGFSAALVEDLTAHRTAALRVELVRNPAVALAATVHALAAALLYHGAANSCLVLRGNSEALDRHTKAVGDSPAHQAMIDEGERWGDRLPGEVSGLFAWCLAQPQDVLLDLLAFLAGLSVDAVQVKQGRGERHQHADRLAEALSLDMAHWWTPSVEGFYQRLPKAALSQAVAEAKASAAVAFDQIKKAEAARLAGKALAGTGWLPEPLRIQAPVQA
jgi:ParB family chromosome partitioning protein